MDKVGLIDTSVHDHQSLRIMARPEATHGPVAFQDLPFTGNVPFKSLHRSWRIEQA
jgi:hypothetical protein